MFRGGRANVHDEKRSDRPSAASDDLVQRVEQKLSCNFKKFHALFSTRLSQLG
jgi:hypothetical protein